METKDLRKKVFGYDIYNGKAIVNSKLAGEILHACSTKAARMGMVERLEKRIADGEFVLTNDMVVINEYGTLVNGVNRLTAIQRSGIEEGVELFIEFRK